MSFYLCMGGEVLEHNINSMLVRHMDMKQAREKNGAFTLYYISFQIMIFT